MLLMALTLTYQTVLPRFSVNVFGFDPNEDLLVNDITDVTLDVTQRRIGGYACDAPEGALDAIGSSIVNELNNLDETVPTLYYSFSY